MLDRDDVIEALKAHEAELKGLGILRLSLFGSAARGDASAQSDVDLAVELTPGPRGLAHLERLDAIKDRLQAILATPIDLIEEPSDLPRVQSEIEKDRVLAF
jgi:uncharacterized protein